MTKPAELRDAKIKAIHQSGEDEATVEMENGNFIDLDIEDLIDDWLHLHRKLQQTKAWAAQAKD